MQAPARGDIRVVEVPATELASRLGARIAANMVMLGFLQEASTLLSEQDLQETIAEQVPAKFLEVNLQAAAQGRALAREKHVTIGI